MFALCGQASVGDASAAALLDEIKSKKLCCSLKELKISGGELKKLGIGVTMTAIFTPQQALLAAKAGASFVAPYVNRLDNILGDGVRVVEDIVTVFDSSSTPFSACIDSF